MGTIAILYAPNLAKRFGQQGFFYEKRSAPVASKSAKVIMMPELECLTLKKGTNFVPLETWQAVEKFDGNQSMLAQMKQQQSLKVFTPNAENPVGSTSDYDNLDDVAEIVGGVNDKAWLNRSLARDQREAVFRLIEQRLKDIQDDELQRSQSDGMVFA